MDVTDHRPCNCDDARAWREATHELAVIAIALAALVMALLVWP